MASQHRGVDLEQQQAEARKEIMAAHARLDRGRPQLCAASRKEQQDPDRNWRDTGSDEKIILIDKAHAQQCADQMTALTGQQQYAYRCPRSRRGHYHLTTSPPRETA